MTVGVFQFQATGATPILVPVTDNSPADIVDATDAAVTLGWLQVNENNGSTPNLTVSMTDGATTIYLGSDSGSTWKAKAVTAGQSVMFSQGIVVPKGWKLQVTSSDAAGRFHVVGVKQRSQ